MSVTRHFPEGIPKAIGPYSPATQTQLSLLETPNEQASKQQYKSHSQNDSQPSIVYISGQIPINPQTNQIDCQNISGQAHQVMKNLSCALEGSGCSFSTVLKTTILLVDMNDFGTVNQIYAGYFQKGQYPARVCYAVRQLPKGSLVEIDAIAIKSALQDGQKPTKKVKITKQQGNC